MRQMHLLVLSFVLSVLVARAGAAELRAAETAAGPLVVTRITPEGEDVPAGRQVVITFDRAVVPLGRMERRADELPISVSPELSCEWRWLSQSALACNLAEAAMLKQSTRYTVVVNPGLTALDGATTVQPLTHRFSTERVAIIHTWFQTWLRPGTPLIGLTFNQPVSREAAAQALVFAHQGKRTEISLSLPEYGDPPVRKEEKTYYRSFLGQPLRELPPDSRVSLHLTAERLSAEGDLPAAATADVVHFDTFPAFAFMGLRCRNNRKEEVFYSPAEAEGSRCDPLGPIALRFSAPLFRSELKKHLTLNPPLGKAEMLDEVWGELSQEYSQLNQSHSRGQGYDVLLPYGLKANQKYSAKAPALDRGYFAWLRRSFRQLAGRGAESGTIHDEFGRPLLGGLALSFSTDNRSPNYELIHKSAVLEQHTDSELPLYVTNIDKVTFNFRSLTAAGAASGLKHEIVPPQVSNIQFAIPFGLREILGGQSGAVYGHLQTEPGTFAKGPGRLFAQLTPWQVHAKIGHFSSLVWVTDMATGAPVAGAQVTLYRDKMAALSAPSPDNILAQGLSDANGLARLPGSEQIDPHLELLRSYGDGRPLLLVLVEKDGELALLPANWDFSIDIWRASNERIYPTQRLKSGHIKAWGATAQGIYRAGDTIAYKIYVRNQNDLTLTPAPRSGYKLEIINPLDNVVHTAEDLTLNDFGALAGDYTVPENAPVGWYLFKLSGAFAAEEQKLDDDTREQNFSWFPLRVLVSDFTPAPFRVTTNLNGDFFRAGEQVRVESSARLHSGGPYTDAAVRVTATYTPREFQPPTPKAKGFRFTAVADSSTQQIYQSSGELNAQGDWLTEFDIAAAQCLFGRLSVESAIRDERGKYVAAVAQAEVVGRDRFVGLKGSRWVYAANSEVEIEYLVLDPAGELIGAVPVEIHFEQQVTKSARVKGAGNAYLTQYSSSWEPAAACQGRSGAEAQRCSFTPKKAGYYRARALITDTQERPVEALLHLWVSGSDFVNWHNQSEVLLSIVPEQTEYQVGDTARFLIKNPWPGATALVSIERYGIIEAFTLKLENSTPIIEIPIKPDYLPGFYLAVLVSSPRAAAAPLAAGLDLGKPAFRLGYLPVVVKDPYKELQITVQSAQALYRPRDRVDVSIQAEPRNPSQAEPIELAVVVLDEAVFDLIVGGIKAYDPYGGFYALAGLDVRSFDLLTRLIGRQKFEKKGANPGGDGGADFSLRDLFKFTAYWNPALRADSAGRAEFSFELPDNLTGWRILAMGVTPTDRLGLGQGTFKVNRPTEIRPVMPNQVSEGDAFRAAFSVMNRTEAARKVTVTVTVAGDLAAAEGAWQHTEQLELEPYKRAMIYLPLQSSRLSEDINLTQGAINFTVQAWDEIDSDGLKHSVPVLKQRALITAADYGTTEEDQVVTEIAIPAESYPDRGGISVVLSPSVVGGVDGAFQYMRDYPYLCWEQILTKGVMAYHYEQLKGYLDDGLVWEGSRELPQQTLDRAATFQAPNGGMVYYLAQDEYVSPYLSAYTALAFNWLRTAGYRIPAPVEQSLHGYLQQLLRNDRFPGFFTESMKATVRAVALAALVKNQKADFDDLLRFRPQVKAMSLFGKAHYLLAALELNGAEKIAEETAKMILSYSQQSGGKFSFSEELDSGYQRILATPIRDNCAILDALTALALREEGRQLVGDLPFKLLRFITQSRQSRSYWQNTQENMFCMQGITAYSRAFEAAPVNMQITAHLGSESLGQVAFADRRNPALTLSRAMSAADPGRQVSLNLERSGSGRLYYSTRLQYAPRLVAQSPLNAGIELRREYSVERDGKWLLLDGPMPLKRGELIRSDIYLSLPTARNFVVVSDPLPGGLETVNRDLATTSVVDAAKGAAPPAEGSWFYSIDDWTGYAAGRWSFYHSELRHDRAVFYSEYLPAGNYHLSYAAQAIAAGTFAHLPVKAEEMYDPDVYGQGAGSVLVIEAE